MTLYKVSILIFEGVHLIHHILSTQSTITLLLKEQSANQRQQQASMPRLSILPKFPDLPSYTNVWFFGRLRPDRLLHST